MKDRADCRVEMLLIAV